MRSEILSNVLSIVSYTSPYSSLPAGYFLIKYSILSCKGLKIELRPFSFSTESKSSIWSIMLSIISELDTDEISTLYSSDLSYPPNSYSFSSRSIFNNPFLYTILISL